VSTKKGKGVRKDRWASIVCLDSKGVKIRSLKGLLTAERSEMHFRMQQRETWERRSPEGERNSEHNKRQSGLEQGGVLNARTLLQEGTSRGEGPEKKNDSGKKYPGVEGNISKV